MNKKKIEIILLALTLLVIFIGFKTGEKTNIPDKIASDKSISIYGYSYDIPLIKTYEKYNEDYYLNHKTVEVSTRILKDSYKGSFLELKDILKKHYNNHKEIELSEALTAIKCYDKVYTGDKTNYILDYYFEYNNEIQVMCFVIKDSTERNFDEIELEIESFLSSIRID